MAIAELLIPIGRRIPVALNQPGMHPSLRGKVAGGFGRGAIGEIGHVFGGRAARPTRPILVYGPAGRILAIIMGAGEAEAAELEDLAHAAMEKRRNQDEMRERFGAAEKRDVVPMLREALEEHGRLQHRQPSEYPIRKRPGHNPQWIKSLPEIKVTE